MPSACLAPLPFAISTGLGQILRKLLRVLLFLPVWLGIRCFLWLQFHCLFGGCRATPSGKQMLFPHTRNTPVSIFQVPQDCSTPRQLLVQDSMLRNRELLLLVMLNWVSHHLHAEGMWKFKAIIVIAFWDVLHTEIREVFARVSKESREK